MPCFDPANISIPITKCVDTTADFVNPLIPNKTKSLIPPNTVTIVANIIKKKRSVVVSLGTDIQIDAAIYGIVFKLSITKTRLLKYTENFITKK